MSLNTRCFVKALALISIFLISACTQTGNSVGTALTPQAASETPTQTNQTALVADTSPTPGQTVTEGQIQQQSAGLADGTTTQSSGQGEVAALDTTNALTFLPVEGAPTTAVTNLSKSLRTSAQENGLAVLPSTRPGAKYQVKGYFSALNDGSSTLLVYVWDVLDSSGKRVHRINGQERSGSSNTDPWLAISDEELARVAERTTARLKSWVDSKKS